MNRSLTYPLRRLVWMASLLALAAALLPLAPAAAAPPPLPPEIAERARLLESAPRNTLDIPPDVPDGDRSSDPSAPTAQLRVALDQVRQLQADASGRTAILLRKAAGALTRSLDTLAEGSGGTTNRHIGVALEDLSRAVVNLGKAQRVSDTTRERRNIRRVRFTIATHGGQLVGPILLQAESVVSGPEIAAARQTFDDALGLLATGDANGAMDGFNETYGGTGSMIEFDVETFEQNLRDTLDGETVGYTYAITTNGVVAAEDGVGEAQTAPDGPAPQFADKQVQIASVSKTLTAILTLRLLGENGVGVNEPIAPYLPGNWILGDGMAQITFAQIMTHTSGLKQLANTLPDNNGIGNDYDGLQTLLGLDLTSGVGPYGYAYTNVGFSLLRVLAFGIMGGDIVDYPEFEGETLTASAFAIYLESVYGGIGVPTTCSPTDPVPTLMYLWPLDGSAGSESGDKVLSCGAFGYFISAHQLARVLVNLRYTENLLSDAQFDVMRDEMLGLKSWSGDHGTYYGHDGQWNPGMHSCVMMFSINVEAALTINSIGGAYASPCTVVRNAFDDAWVAA